MTNKRTLLVSLALGVATAIVAVGLYGQPLYSAAGVALERLVPGLRAGPDSLYTYSVETKASGKVYVTVKVDFRDPGIRQRYLEANKAKAQVLLGKGGAAIPVTVTFSKPVPIMDFEALVKATGFEVDRYVLETRDAQGNWGSASGAPREGKLIDMEYAAPIAERLGVSFRGAAVLIGKVSPTADGLGRLLSDQRVYLADVVAGEVADKVAAETGRKAEDIRVDVSTPATFLALGFP